MVNSRCIVSVAFREPYISHSNNQLKKLGSLPAIIYRDALPYKEGVVTNNIVERFQQSLYGFKPHAIQTAIDKGYSQVIWMDPSVLPTCDLNKVFEELEQTDMLVLTSGNHISKMTSERAFTWFDTTKDIPVNHIGGTFYGFNFNNAKTYTAFNLWKGAEEGGIFGNQAEFMSGHWADESCMALAMYKAGVEQKQSKFLTYKNQKDDTTNRRA
jgi:hypothetical protein